MDQRFYKTADGQSGLFFTALGAFVVWQSSTYSIGTVAKMGPGYFPLVLGILLTIVGLAVTFKSIRTPQEAAARFEWRSAIAITGAIVLSGLLLLTAGLVVAVPVLVIVSSFAAREQSLVDRPLDGPCPHRRSLPDLHRRPRPPHSALLGLSHGHSLEPRTRFRHVAAARQPSLLLCRRAARDRDRRAAGARTPGHASRCSYRSPTLWTRFRR